MMTAIRRVMVSILGLAIMLPVGAQAGPKPDLVVGAIWATSKPILSGDNYIVSIAVRVENKGTANAGPFQIAIMKALEAPPGAESEVQFRIAGGPISGLRADNKLEISGIVTIAPRSESGKKLKIRALVDSQTQVAESDETNNVSPWFEVQLPIEVKLVSREVIHRPAEGLADFDLSEADITIFPHTPICGGVDIIVEANSRNIGTAEARDVAVYFWLLDASSRIKATRTEIIPTIPGRSSKKVSTAFGGNLVEMGNYWVKVTIDGPGRITESREDNNMAQKAFNVVTPDLSITAAEIEISPALPRVRDSIYFLVPVRNNGNGDALDVIVRYQILNNSGRVVLEYTGSELTIDRIPARGFNIYRLSSIDFTRIPEGDYALKISIETRKACKEPDMNNNRAERLFSVTR
jgi:hypothetical protein